MFSLNTVRVVCDESRKVIFIHFDAKISEYVFNAKDLTAQDFVQAFADAYPSNMKRKKGFWESLNLETKVLIRIGDDKEFVIQKVTNPDALTTHFN